METSTGKVEKVEKVGVMREHYTDEVGGGLGLKKVVVNSFEV